MIHMKIFKAGHKTYIAVSKALKKPDALTYANKYFKAKKAYLRLQEGQINGDELDVGVKGDVWVVSRRERV